MTDFTPAPWPDSIRSYFTEKLAEVFPIAEVPAFLHPLIEEYTQVLATSEPDFRYENIQIKFSGTVLVTLEDADVYDQGFLEAVEAMEHTLTSEVFLQVAESTEVIVADEIKSLWDALLKDAPEHDESVVITSADVNQQTADRIAELSKTDPK